MQCRVYNDIEYNEKTRVNICGSASVDPVEENLSVTVSGRFGLGFSRALQQSALTGVVQQILDKGFKRMFAKISSGFLMVESIYYLSLSHLRDYAKNWT